MWASSFSNLILLQGYTDASFFRLNRHSFFASVRHYDNHLSFCSGFSFRVRSSGIYYLGSIVVKFAINWFLLSLSLSLSLSQKPYGNIWAKLEKALEIWRGFGMSVQGVRTCGDYMFSGHTVTLTMLNFFITECNFFISLNLLHFLSSKHLISFYRHTS